MCVLLVPAAEYGSVICDGVEMADIPSELQEARVFKLHLRNNGLHRFPDAKLQGTGTYVFKCMFDFEIEQLQHVSLSPFFQLL